MRIILALALILAAAVTGPATAVPADDCQTSLDLDPGAGRVGRPCKALPLPSGACFPAGTFNSDYPDEVCTFYVFLLPFDDGTVTGPLTLTLVWAETNGIGGLQRTPVDGHPSDTPFLV